MVHFLKGGVGVLAVVVLASRHLFAKQLAISRPSAYASVVLDHENVTEKESSEKGIPYCSNMTFGVSGKGGTGDGVAE